MSLLKKYTTLIVALFFAAMGISLQLKAMIGVAPFDAFNQTVSFITGQPVGNIVMYVNILFILLQILILRKDTTWRIFLQIIVGVLLGQFVNLFVYYVFDSLVLDNYIMQLLLFILGCLWVPFFLGAIIVLDLVTMPVENTALLISEKTRFTFGQFRQFLDIGFVILALILTYVFSEDLTIREGTVISALTFGPLFSVYMPRIEKVFYRWGLIESVSQN